jgi:hypothetical protein
MVGLTSQGKNNHYCPYLRKQFNLGNNELKTSVSLIMFAAKFFVPIGFFPGHEYIQSAEGGERSGC